MTLHAGRYLRYSHNTDISNCEILEKKSAKNGQYSCSKKCFEGHEDLRFFDAALLGLLAVWGLASKLVLRATVQISGFLVSLSGVLESFSRLTSKLSLRAVLRTGAALQRLGRKQMLAILCVLEREFLDTNVRHSLSS